MKKEYWIVSAQRPAHLFLGIFKSEKEAKELDSKTPDKRCPIIYPCTKEMIESQFGWRKYMTKWLNEIN